MSSRPPPSTRARYCSLPSRAAGLRYRSRSEPAILFRSPRWNDASPERSNNAGSRSAGQQLATLPKKEDPGPSQRALIHKETLGLGGSESQPDVEMMSKASSLFSDPSSHTADIDLEPPQKAEAGPSAFGYPLVSLTTHECPMPSIEEKDLPQESMALGAPTPPKAGRSSSFVRGVVGEQAPADSLAIPTVRLGYLRWPDNQPTAAPSIYRDNGDLEPISECEDSKEDEEDDRSSEDDGEPAHRFRITASMAYKATFKRRAVRPGAQDDREKNWQLRLQAKEARFNLAAKRLVTDDAVILSSRAQSPDADLLSKMQKLALGQAVRNSRLTRNQKRS